MGAIQFVENMDKTTLTISDDEFERNVEAAVSAIAEKHHHALPLPPSPLEKSPTTLRSSGETPRLSYESEGPPRRSTSSNYGSDPSDEQAALTGLLRTIQKPLTSIGRIFTDDSGPSGFGNSPSRSPQPVPVPSRRDSVDEGKEKQPQPQKAQHHERHHYMSAEEAAARQASAEAAEAQRLHRVEHATIVETLSGMFPDLDREIISDVVYQQQGR